MSAFDKAALKAELVARLQADLDAAERAHKATIAGATHEEAKPENDKDTRALEQTYLARGQAARVDELRAALADVSALAVRSFEGKPAGLGALVALEEDGKRSTLLLAPGGGGTYLAEGTVQVVTPRSPLGREVIGKTAGDSIEMVLAGKTRDIEVVEVA